MNRLAQILSLIIIVILSSCKDDEVPSPGDYGVKHCVKSKLQINFDGSSIGYTKFRYNGEGELMDELTYDTKDVLSDSSHHEYLNGNKIRTFSFNFTMGVWQEQKWQYNANNRIKSYTFSINSQPYNSDEYFYHSNGEIDSIITHASGTRSTAVYEYSRDTIRKIVKYDMARNMISSQSFQYGTGNMKVETIGANGKLVSTVETIYNAEGKVVEVKHFNDQGMLTISQTTEYDDKGNVVKLVNVYEGHGRYEYLTTWKCE